MQEAKQIGTKQTPNLISKIATPLENIVLTRMPIESKIDHVFIFSEDAVIGNMLKTAVLSSGEVSHAYWKNDIQLEIKFAKDKFDYTAVYIDIGLDWPNKKNFIRLIREKYPIVPFVLVGSREVFLGSIEEEDKRKFEHYFFFDTRTPVAMVSSRVVETLAQIGWDITKRYGEKVQD